MTIIKIEKKFGLYYVTRKANWLERLIYPKEITERYFWIKEASENGTAYNLFRKEKSNELIYETKKK